MSGPEHEGPEHEGPFAVRVASSADAPGLAGLFEAAARLTDPGYS